VFSVATFCSNTSFQSFSTLISCIVHYTTLCWNSTHIATSRCRKPQHVRINTRAPPVACPVRSISAMQIIGSTKAAIQQLLFVFFWGNVNNQKYMNNNVVQVAHFQCPLRSTLETRLRARPIVFPPQSRLPSSAPPPQFQRRICLICIWIIGRDGARIMTGLAAHAAWTSASRRLRESNAGGLQWRAAT